uniref:Serpin domain-containing protein n=1 Tax=Sus scrofa TaxID=9823 RepID=A0A8D0S916_PIG
WRFIASLLGLVHCVPESKPDPENGTPKDQHSRTPVDPHAIVPSNTDFAFSLYKQLVSLDPSKNVIFSPLSVSMALAFLSLGARGPTLTELLEGLKFNLTKTPEAEIHQGFQHLLQALSQPSNLLQLNVGNAMFVDERLKLLDKFVQDARELYFSEAFSLSFKDSDAAVEFINNYVKNKTKGKIVDLFKQLSPDTVLVLVNCIYFKAGSGQGLPGFSSVNEGTESHVSGKQSRSVLGCLMFESPVLSFTQASFLAPSDEALTPALARLSPETMSAWPDRLLRITALHLPRFSVSGDYKLHDILPHLGIKKVFSHQADLSGITDQARLEVSQVVHRAVLDVDEEGTEGAAATGISIQPTSLVFLTVHFNRPFLFFIIHKDTQSIIFSGKVTDPSSPPSARSPH